MEGTDEKKQGKAGGARGRVKKQWVWGCHDSKQRERLQAWDMVKTSRIKVREKVRTDEHGKILKIGGQGQGQQGKRRARLGQGRPSLKL